MRRESALPVLATEDESAGDPREIWRDGAMTVPQACDFAAVGRSTLYEAMGSGRLVFAHVGRRRVVARRSLVALLADAAR